MAREADPQTQLTTLAKEISDGDGLARGYVFRGDEPWFREQGARFVARCATEAGHEVTRHDAADPDFNAASLMDDLAARPMFASERCIVVRGASSLLKKVGKADAPLTRAVKAFLTGPLGGTVVLDAEGLRADNAALKAIVKEGGTAVNCRKLWDAPPPWAAGDPAKAELVQWLLGRARKRKLQLSPNDAVLLATATGNDLYALEAQLEKLRYAPRDAGRAAGPDGGIVRAVAGDERSVAPWTLAEQLCRGDVRSAAAGIEHLFRSGFAGRDGKREVDPRALCAILMTATRSKVRQALAGARVLERGGNAAKAAEAAGIGTWPKARTEFEERLSARPASAWPAMLVELNALERATRENRTVDANDFLVLALRWARKAPAQAARSSAR
jgi:DNA polymerase III delta subunit